MRRPKLMLPALMLLALAGCDDPKPQAPDVHTLMRAVCLTRVPGITDQTCECILAHQKAALDPALIAWAGAMLTEQARSGAGPDAAERDALLAATKLDRATAWARIQASERAAYAACKP